VSREAALASTPPHSRAYRLLVRCSRCREYLPPEAYRLDRAGRLRSHCGACGVEVNREWRAANRERYTAYRRDRYAALRAGGLTPSEASDRR